MQRSSGICWEVLTAYWNIRLSIITLFLDSSRIKQLVAQGAALWLVACSGKHQFFFIKSWTKIRRIYYNGYVWTDVKYKSLRFLAFGMLLDTGVCPWVKSLQSVYFLHSKFELPSKRMRQPCLAACSLFAESVQIPRVGESLHASWFLEADLAITAPKLENSSCKITKKG